jgi:predicted permease
MKLKKSIALLLPLLIFSQFAYADIDSHPDIIMTLLFLTIVQLGLLIIFIIAFIKRFDGNDHRANKWIYLSSFFMSCFIIRYLYVTFGDSSNLKFFISLVFALIFLIFTCVITYKKSNTKSDQ